MNDLNELEEWLNCIGASSEETRTRSENVPAVPSTPPPEEPVPVPLSNNDFDDILAENGFTQPLYDEAEIVPEDEEGDEVQREPEEHEERTIHLDDYAPSPGLEEAMNDMQERILGVQQEPEHPQETEQLPAEAPMIPPNSPTLLINDSTSRFSGAEWFNEIQKSRIILAGLGGIGSWTALQLARMSPASLVLYDDDTVEMANMSGQLYMYEDVGEYKVDAIEKSIMKYTTAQNIYGVRERFEINTAAGDIMICGFDNMIARRTFFEAWKNHVINKPAEEMKKCLYLDGIINCFNYNL